MWNESVQLFHSSICNNIYILLLFLISLFIYSLQLLLHMFMYYMYQCKYITLTYICHLGVGLGKGGVAERYACRVYPERRDQYYPTSLSYIHFPCLMFSLPPPLCIFHCRFSSPVFPSRLPSQCVRSNQNLGQPDERLTSFSKFSSKCTRLF